jgi:cell division protein FtsB
MKRFWVKLSKPFTRVQHYKYWLVAGLFLILMSFFDENNFIKRIENEREIHRLQDQIDVYNQTIQHNLEQINELKTSNANLEKFVRETYGMKRANEDVYIIKEK